jgi:hypothetical protein
MALRILSKLFRLARKSDLTETYIASANPDNPYCRNCNFHRDTHDPETKACPKPQVLVTREVI